MDIMKAAYAIDALGHEYMVLLWNRYDALTTLIDIGTDERIRVETAYLQEDYTLYDSSHRPL